jgi:diketogulonate reductase-like aldo/keto reductase
MLTRPIPSTGEAMPVIGLGTWRAFDVGTDEATRQPLREVLRLFLDAGGRIIDSSPMYGRAEAVTGDLLTELAARPRAFLATKVWTTGGERGVEQMRRSAQLLRAEVIDLMQIHNLVDWRTHLTGLRRMKEEGHIHRDHPLHGRSAAGTRAHPRPRAGDRFRPARLLAGNARG